MRNEKISWIIEAVKNLPEGDAELLDVFIAGLIVGRRLNTEGEEAEKQGQIGA